MIKELAKSDEVSKAITVTVGTFGGSIFAYLLQIFLGRWLSVEDFGVVTALLSLALILGILTATFTTALIKLVAKLAGKGKFDTLTHLFMQLIMILFGVGLVFFCLVFFFRDNLAGFLSISDLELFVPYGIFIGVSFLSLLSPAYLQGLLRFRSYAAFVMLRQFLRLLFSVIAVVLGFGLVGVFSSMSVAVVISFLVGIVMLKRNFAPFGKDDLKLYYRGFLSFAGAVLFVQIGMTLLNNVDVILVKHFFDEVSAGLYAGLVTVGKVLLFGASTVGMVMFPMISSAYGKGEDYLAKFKPLLILQVAVVFVGVVFFSAFPNLITGIMFGESYLPSAVHLPRFALFVGFYVLINFMVLFFLAIERMKIFQFLIPAIIAQVILIIRYHESIANVVTVNLVVSFTLLVGVMLYFVKSVKLESNRT